MTFYRFDSGLCDQTQKVAGTKSILYSHVNTWNLFFFSSKSQSFSEHVINTKIKQDVLCLSLSDFSKTIWNIFIIIKIPASFWHEKHLRS